MPTAQNHARKDAEKTKQNPKDRTKIHCTNNKTSYKTKQLFPRKKGGKKTAKQIQAYYCCSRSGY